MGGLIVVSRGRARFLSAALPGPCPAPALASYCSLYRSSVTTGCLGKVVRCDGVASMTAGAGFLWLLLCALRGVQASARRARRVQRVRRVANHVRVVTSYSFVRSAAPSCLMGTAVVVLSGREHAGPLARPCRPQFILFFSCSQSPVLFGRDVVVVIPSPYLLQFLFMGANRQIQCKPGGCGVHRMRRW